MTRKILSIFAAPALVCALLLYGCGPARTAKTDAPVEVKPPIAQAPVEAPPVAPPPVEPPPVEPPPPPKWDTLADVKAKGVLVVGVRDTAPPFGSINPRTNYADLARSIANRLGLTVDFKTPTDGNREGYDIDFAHYIANRLGVKVEFKTVTAGNRLSMLEDGRVDIIAAAMIKTPERAQRIDFSYTYFSTGQKFLAPKGMLKTNKDLEKMKVGTARGSNAERSFAAAFPTANITLFDDYPKAIEALLQKKIHAVTADETILAGQLCLLEKKFSTKGKFEIPDLRVSTELYGLGIRKNDEAFLNFVNEILLRMERTGEALRIFEHWFGPNSECPIKRGVFRIVKD